MSNILAWIATGWLLGLVTVGGLIAYADRWAKAERN
jgi:hypothetical protein